MSVRKTESRIPAGFQAPDLGDSVVADDGRCALVSFITSPLVAGRENTYVLYVTDAALAGDVDSFEWTFTENGDAVVTQTTPHGEISYTPNDEGDLSVLVRLLDAGTTERAQLSFEQSIGALNSELEALITDSTDQPGPGAGNPDVARELVNDLVSYYHDVTLKTAEDGDGFQRFVFGIALGGALQRTRAARKQQLDELAASLNGDATDFVTLTASGLGVCQVRLPLLAMTLPKTPGGAEPMLAWTELPQAPGRHELADEELRQVLAQLDLDTRIDLFNLVRCPKSNISVSARMIEGLRDHYFAGTNFDDVIAGLSGTRAHWITRHLLEGPLERE